MRALKMQSQARPDDFQTPAVALGPLYPYLPPSSIVWECAAGRGNLVRALQGGGYNVIASDLLTGQDFRMWTPDSFDVIVTNPPFSLKGEFLERAYLLGKPFAFLLPLTTFEGLKRHIRDSNGHPYCRSCDWVFSSPEALRSHRRDSPYHY